MYDLAIRGGLVVDGTGLPGRHADVGIRDGRVLEIGSLAGRAAVRNIDAEGLVVAPGIVDVHTHYDPQITWDPLCDTSALHGVTTVVAGNCGFSVAPCRSEDRDYTAQMFARVEGMSPGALEHVRWAFTSFAEFLASRGGRLGLNLGMYIGHSAIRRFAMGEAAHERGASPDEVEQMVALVEDAMAAGALGLSSSHAPTHLDSFDRPVPSRLASLDELRTLADAVGRTGHGSIAYAPESAVEGIGAADRELLIELARRGGVPAITQGLGGRSKVDAPEATWREARTFLDDSAARGTPVYSLLMTRALNGPFTLRDGTSRYEGVPLWHAFMDLDPAEKRKRLADPIARQALRHAIDAPNRDARKGSTLPPPIWDSLLVAASDAPALQRFIGQFVGDIARAEGRHPADVMLDAALASDLRAVFHWSNETAAWRTLLREVQRHPQMIVGVSDGGAHLDRDDGAEWSTHFLCTWWRDEGVWSLEEAIRRITALPACICGITDRGVLRSGLAADVFLFDPKALDVGQRRLEPDPSTGSQRFRSVPRGIRMTVVNGEPVVEDGEATGARPGRIVRPQAR